MTYRSSPSISAPLDTCTLFTLPLIPTPLCPSFERKGTGSAWKGLYYYSDPPSLLILADLPTISENSVSHGDQNRRHGLRSGRTGHSRSLNS